MDGDDRSSQRRDQLCKQLPYEPLVGNTPTAPIFMWSIISIYAGIGALAWYSAEKLDVCCTGREPEGAFCRVGAFALFFPASLHERECTTHALTGATMPELMRKRDKGSTARGIRERQGLHCTSPRSLKEKQDGGANVYAA